MNEFLIRKINNRCGGFETVKMKCLSSNIDNQGVKPLKRFM